MNIEFEQWLTGFLEGDGSVGYEVRPNTYTRKDGHRATHNRLVVNFTQKDPSPLEYIRDTLGYGNFTFGKRDGTTRLSIFGEPHSLPLLEAFVKHVVTENIQQRLVNTLKVLGIEHEPPLHEPTLDWFVGFWDAEGTSSITGPLHSQLTLNVTQKDKNTLEKIQDSLGHSHVTTDINWSGNEIHRLTFSDSYAYKLANILLEKSKHTTKHELLREHLVLAGRLQPLTGAEEREVQEHYEKHHARRREQTAHQTPEAREKRLTRGRNYYESHKDQRRAYNARKLQETKAIREYMKEHPEIAKEQQ